jgi:methyltransferase OMS1
MYNLLKRSPQLTRRPLGSLSQNVLLVSSARLSLRYFSAPKPSRPPAPPPKNLFKTKYKQIKLGWKQLNEHPSFRTWASLGMILLYVATAYAGIQYLNDTKYKATGEPNPYKKKEDLEKERLEKTQIGEIKEANASKQTGSSDAHAKCNHDKNGLNVPAPRDTTDIFDGLAREYDNKIWFEELSSHIWYRRRQLMKQVKGDALEVSCGTGRNIPYFDKEKIDSITFLDSSKTMLEIAREKFTKKYPEFEKVQYVRGKAEDLAKMASHSGQKFDTIFETFGLCSHEDPQAALENFKALLRPNGRIVLLEHGRSSYDSLNQTMDKKAEQRVKEWGCRWNLDIDAIVQDSGLEILESKKYHFGSTYYYILKRNEDE